MPAERARSLTLVEIDPELAAGLRETTRRPSHVTVIESDALELDLADSDGRPFSS